MISLWDDPDDFEEVPPVKGKWGRKKLIISFVATIMVLRYPLPHNTPLSQKRARTHTQR